MTNQAQQVNNMFLIGAGFTKAVFPSAPLNKDLLPVLCKGTPSCTVLKKYRKEFKTDDIEILLTRLDLETTIPKAKRQSALQTSRKAIEQELANHFKQFRFKEEIISTSNWLKDFVNLFQPRDAIISLNYDCLLEGVLDYYEKWSPKGGYAKVDNELAKNLPENSKGIIIYKIHGSENFVRSSGSPGSGKKFISYEINEALFPRSGKYSVLSGGAIDPKTYIIAPSFIKLPDQEIEQMMINALGVAAHAKNLIIIGCGLRPEDTFLWLLLTAFLDRKGPAGARKLIIADPCAERLKEKIRDHYFVDINAMVDIRLLPERLECVVRELIDELHNTDNQERRGSLSEPTRRTPEQQF